MASRKQDILPVEPDGDIGSAPSQRGEQRQAVGPGPGRQRLAGGGARVQSRPAPAWAPPGNRAPSEEFGLLFSLVGKYLEIIHMILADSV